MASNNVRRSSLKRRLFQGHEQIKEETVYRYDTIVSFKSGKFSYFKTNTCVLEINY